MIGMSGVLEAAPRLAKTAALMGAGTITYRATNSLTVRSTFPPCTAGINTAESSNVTYGELARRQAPRALGVECGW